MNIAVGTVTITNQRVIFQSDKQAREFLFSKLIGYQHDPDHPLTFFQVSNRQKTSGIGYDRANSRTIRFRLALAIAEFQGNTRSLLEIVRAEIAKHERAKPQPPQLIGSADSLQSPVLTTATVATPKTEA